MAIEAASSPEQTYDPGPWHTDWKDEAWRAFIGSIDAWLRAYYRIEEFTGEPRCVLRIGFMKAVMPVLLSDGTEIHEGERIGALHLWNEHVPRYAGNGPNLAWAKEMRRRMLWSLGLLADYIEHDPAWQTVQAFCGDSVLLRRPDAFEPAGRRPAAPVGPALWLLDCRAHTDPLPLSAYLRGLANRVGA